MFIILCIVLWAPLDAADAAEKPWLSGSIFPAWYNQKAAKIIGHHYKKNQSAEQNGAALASAVQSLKAGQHLIIEGGTYSVNKVWDVILHGTAKDPIAISAAPRHKVIITRPDRKQNVMNVGMNTQKPTAYVCFRGLEFRGGSSVVRFFHCSNVWLDQCHLHDGGNVGLSANTYDTDHIYITRNHIHDPGPASATSEGMYLGGNDGKVVMRNSVIAYNEVHDCHGTQGDGIELKQGSYDNWIIGNRVYNCDYPCIIAYGNKGKGVNLIENNVCYQSQSEGMQVQGDAIVRNNLVINNDRVSFSTRDHQGSVQNLQVINNTFVSAGNAVELRNWNNKTNMIFANNACYSSGGAGIKIVGGANKAKIAGNIYYGSIDGDGQGFKRSKNGLKDFVALSVDATYRDARPIGGSVLLAAAVPVIQADYDMYHLPRSKKTAHAGAVMPRKKGVGELTVKLSKAKIKGFKKDTADWQREEPGPLWNCEVYKVKRERISVFLPPEADEKKKARK
ncbi:MAG: right-handed parallel beta-helix repeat-containing protein [Planctomycetes bacterium]|nr:right-handed parallel beta-helix repeat-containing protein [Planctomycetota bacterium]